MNAPRILVHPSQFPDRVRRNLEDGIRSGQIPHKYHYDSYKQARAWLALHEAYSPARIDPACVELYRRVSSLIWGEIGSDAVDIIGLGCGGGQKDAALIQQGMDRGRTIRYTPVDTSLPLVLTAWLEARRSGLGPENAAMLNSGIVCDLLQTRDLHRLFDSPRTGESARLLTFFGMIPNFEPTQVIPKLAGWAGRGGWLLLSANLAPGKHYGKGVERIRPNYENALTEAWLQLLLWDLGLEPDDGRIQWMVKRCPGGSDLLRVQADFVISRSCVVRLGTFSHPWDGGDRLRLFFSYRYTPSRLNNRMSKFGWRLRQQWISPSEEEGVFLYRRG